MLVIVLEISFSSHFQVVLKTTEIRSTSNLSEVKPAVQEVTGSIPALITQSGYSDWKSATVNFITDQLQL